MAGLEASSNESTETTTLISYYRISFGPTANDEQERTVLQAGSWLAGLEASSNESTETTTLISYYRISFGPTANDEQERTVLQGFDTMR